MDFLAAHAARMPHHPCLIDGDRVIGYARMEELSNRLANAMLDLGLRSHGHLTTVGYNAAEHSIVGSAARKLVLVSMPMNYRLTPEEIEYQLAHSETEIVFAGPEHVERVEKVAARCPKLAHKVAWGVGAAELPPGWRRFDELVAAGKPEPPPIEAGLTGPSMTYTAGTTGNPKGAYRAEGTDPEVVRKYAEWFDMKPGDVHLVAGPMYHSAPGAFAGFTTIFGGTNVIMRRFDAERALELIDRHRVTTTFMAPILLRRIVGLPDEVKQKYDVSSMRVIIVAAAPCPFELKRQVMDLFGEVLYEFYGSSELGVNTLMRPEEQLQKPGSCGRLVEGVEIKVLDDQGHEVPTGQSGELWIRSPQEITEYWHNEEATGQSRRGGHFTVGDVGYFDDDGYLYIVDRKRDMVISGGVNVCTTEVENAIHAHPKVWDVVVIGIPSEEWGESVHAIVQPQQGETIDEDELLAFLGEHLADYKKPRSIEFREELPRDEAGKIRKRELREPFWEGQEKRV